MTKQSEHLAARRMRAAGATYREIAAALGVSISSVSLWTRDLPAPTPRPEAVRARLDGTHARWTAYRVRRDGIARAAEAEVGRLTDRELRLVGTALYWAEGAKAKPWRSHTQLTFVNSDPAMIQVFLRFLELCGVDRGCCAFRVSIHSSADVAAAEEFWARVVGVPADRFQRTTLKRHRPATQRRNSGDSYRGCLAVRVAKPALHYARIEGWWRGIAATAQAQDDR